MQRFLFAAPEQRGGGRQSLANEEQMPTTRNALVVATKKAGETPALQAARPVVH